MTTQGKRKLGDELLERIDPRGQPYVWIGGLRSDDGQQAGTDLQAVAEQLHLGHAGPHGHDPPGQLRAPPSRAEVDSSRISRPAKIDANRAGIAVEPEVSVFTFDLICRAICSDRWLTTY